MTVETVEEVISGDVVPDGKGCVLWGGPRTQKGYGLVEVDGANRWAAHVVQEELGKPRPSDGHVLRWTCGRPGCVAPVHLYWADRGSVDPRKMQDRVDLLVAGLAPLTVLGQELSQSRVLGMIPGSAELKAQVLKVAIESGCVSARRERTGYRGRPRYLHKVDLDRIPRDQLVRATKLAHNERIREARKLRAFFSALED